MNWRLAGCVGEAMAEATKNGRMTARSFIVEVSSQKKCCVTFVLFGMLLMRLTIPSRDQDRVYVSFIDEWIALSVSSSSSSHIDRMQKAMMSVLGSDSQDFTFHCR